MDHLSAARAGPWPASDGAADDDPEPAGGSDDVFKALADPSRRLLLDSLFVDDGQTLGDLSARLPGMTRFGVMKHLRLLEAAGLVTSRKIGREKLHYLNPVPIRLIHDRWTSKYAEPWVGALADLKVNLEGPASGRPRHVFQVYIRTTPERLWQAISDPEVTQRYFHSSRVDSQWRPGDRVAYWIADEVAVDGEVLEVDPPHTLVTTWSFRKSPDLRDDPPSRVTWEIEPMEDATCRLTVVHDDFPGETRTFQSVRSGWPLVLSSLKSLLETGAALTVSR
ncbi:MAG TPA: SRPBCC domain-containing protein [Chloroflexota bacterium]|nr:SRPBCC domain-containing protein [Chloroflexota bacterium]